MPRRRRSSPKADEDGVSVHQVTQRHEIAESLIYNWRSARSQDAAIANEALEFIFCAANITTESAAPQTMSTPPQVRRSVSSPMSPAPEELTRPRPGAIGKGLPPGLPVP